MPPLRQGILWWPQPSPWHQNCWTENPRKIKEGHLKPLRRGPSRTWLLTRTNMSQNTYELWLWNLYTNRLPPSTAESNALRWGPFSVLGLIGLWQKQRKLVDGFACICAPLLQFAGRVCLATMAFLSRDPKQACEHAHARTHTHRFVCDSPWLRQHPLSVRCSPTNKQANKQKTRSTFVLHVHAVQ